jgi:hypothetical protein
MFELMKQAIEVLKHKVVLNLDEIRKNELEYRKYLSQGNKIQESDQMLKILEKNKNLLNENFDLINLHISLLKFIEKHEAKQVLSGNNDLENFESEMPEIVDVFDMTVSGEMDFTPKHPLFWDETFFGKLMKYFEESEQFEKCSMVIKAKVSGNLN